MDLWEFYEHVEQLISDLRTAGHQMESEEVESAIRGGATSGEVLGRLSAALSAVANTLPEEFRDEAQELGAWASRALGPR